jgi:hypothetical protein
LDDDEKQGGSRRRGDGARQRGTQRPGGEVVSVAGRGRTLAG